MGSTVNSTPLLVNNGNIEVTSSANLSKGASTIIASADSSIGESPALDIFQALSSLVSKLGEPTLMLVGTEEYR